MDTILAYPSCVVEEWLEQFIIPPHVPRLQAQSQSGLVSHPNSHNLVEVIPSRLGRRKVIGVKDGDIRRRVSRSKEVQGRRGSDCPATSNDDDRRGIPGVRHGTQSSLWSLVAPSHT